VIKILLKNNFGYSLIEIMVAVAILGIVTAPFLTIFSESFSSIVESGKKSTAINLGREKMETVKSGGYDQAYEYFIAGSESPLVEDSIINFPGYLRITEVAPANLETYSLPAEIELLSIKITVYWTTRGIEYSESLESKLARR